MFGAETFGDAREAYLGGSVATASPARILVMLVERLELDVRRGAEALHAGGTERAHHALVHAQEIVLELMSSLRPELFSGGADLLALYDYLHRRLMAANLDKDAAIAEECVALTADLADTWRQAALQSAQSAVGA
jgi:flagellar protein FliS